MDRREPPLFECMSRKGHVSVLDRPIQHLYPLEVVPSSDPAPEEENEDNVYDEESASETLVTGRPRPKRFAAEQAHDCILAQAISETEFEQ